MSIKITKETELPFAPLGAVFTYKPESWGKAYWYSDDTKLSMSCNWANFLLKTGYAREIPTTTN